MVQRQAVGGGVRVTIEAREPSLPLTGAAAILIAALALWFARAGLFVYFTGDDLMNIYAAWRKPIHQLLLENVLFFSAGYRPLGNLVYRILFETVGFHPLPYRLVCFSLILANLYILYRAAAAIAGKEAGLLAALFAAFNAGFIDLYYNTGTIYDLLCFTFYFLAFGFYANVRMCGEYLTPRAMAVFLILYICALNAKEMAVTLPLILVVYESVLGRPRRYWGPAILSAALTVPYVIGKFSAASPLTGNPGYHLRFTPRTYLRAFAHYLSVFTYQSEFTFNIAATILFLLLLAALAALGRRRCLIFLWFFILISPLPAAFIPQRGGYAMYVPSFGLALFPALLVARVRGHWHLSQVGTFAICLIAVFVFHSGKPLPPVSANDALIRSTAAQLAGIAPKLDPKSRVLFLDDPFAKDSWDQLFLLRLMNRAPDMVVDRVKRMPETPDRRTINSYDRFFRYEGSVLRECPAISSSLSYFYKWRNGE